MALSDISTNVRDRKKWGKWAFSASFAFIIFLLLALGPLGGALSVLGAAAIAGVALIFSALAIAFFEEYFKDGGKKTPWWQNWKGNVLPGVLALLTTLVFMFLWNFNIIFVGLGVAAGPLFPIVLVTFAAFFYAPKIANWFFGKLGMTNSEKAIAFMVGTAFIVLLLAFSGGFAGLVGALFIANPGTLIAAALLTVGVGLAVGALVGGLTRLFLKQFSEAYRSDKDTAVERAVQKMLDDGVIKTEQMQGMKHLLGDILKTAVNGQLIVNPEILNRMDAKQLNEMITRLGSEKIKHPSDLEQAKQALDKLYTEYDIRASGDNDEDSLKARIGKRLLKLVQDGTLPIEVLAVMKPEEIRRVVNVMDVTLDLKVDNKKIEESEDFKNASKKVEDWEQSHTAVEQKIQKLEQTEQKISDLKSPNDSDSMLKHLKTMRTDLHVLEKQVESLQAHITEQEQLLDQQEKVDKKPQEQNQNENQNNHQPQQQEELRSKKEELEQKKKQLEEKQKALQGLKVSYTSLAEQYKIKAPLLIPVRTSNPDAEKKDKTDDAEINKIRSSSTASFAKALGGLSVAKKEKEQEDLTGILNKVQGSVSSSSNNGNSKPPVWMKGLASNQDPQNLISTNVNSNSSLHK